MPQTFPSVLLSSLKKFAFEGIQQYCRILKGSEHIEPIFDYNYILISTCQVFQLLEVEHFIVGFNDVSGPNVKLECRNKPIIEPISENSSLRRTVEF